MSGILSSLPLALESKVKVHGQQFNTRQESETKIETCRQESTVGQQSKATELCFKNTLEGGWTSSHRMVAGWPLDSGVSCLVLTRQLPRPCGELPPDLPETHGPPFFEVGLGALCSGSGPSPGPQAWL